MLTLPDIMTIATGKTITEAPVVHVTQDCRPPSREPASPRPARCRGLRLQVDPHCHLRPGCLRPHDGLARSPGRRDLLLHLGRQSRCAPSSAAGRPAGSRRGWSGRTRRQPHAAGPIGPPAVWSRRQFRCTWRVLRGSWLNAPGGVNCIRLRRSLAGAGAQAGGLML